MLLAFGPGITLKPTGPMSGPPVGAEGGGTAIPGGDGTSPPPIPAGTGVIPPAGGCCWIGTVPIKIGICVQRFECMPLTTATT